MKKVEKIALYERIMNDERDAHEVWVEAQRKAGVAYQAYLEDCAVKINEFLGKKGSDKRYVPEHAKDYDEFITDEFELGSNEQEAVIAFVKTLPSFNWDKWDIELRITNSAYKAFYALNIPLNLKRKDFSSKENFMEYRNHIYSATHDFD